MNREFSRFLELVGSTAAAMALLDCSDSLVYKMRNGERSVSPERAKVIITKYPEISLYGLILPNEAA